MIFIPLAAVPPETGAFYAIGVRNVNPIRPRSCAFPSRFSAGIVPETTCADDTIAGRPNVSRSPGCVRGAAFHGSGFLLIHRQSRVPRAQVKKIGEEDPVMKLLNPDDLIAIDIHTHAEEPCGCHADDGYDDFQAQMAEYFKSPHKHPPTV
jgi:hypothetical protein